MSKWGTRIRIVKGENSIEVITHVKTAGWKPIGRDDKIDLVMLVNQQGLPAATAEMFENAKRDWIGKVHFREFGNSDMVEIRLSE